MKIMTLNTWQECGPWEKRWQVIFEGLDRYQPDIIGFQEVFNPDWARVAQKRSGMQHLVFSEDPTGLMILSRFPVRHWSSYTMKTKSPTENYMRYALFAELQIGKHRLAVFNTHLSWKLDEGSIREDQVSELLAFINEKAAGQETVVMGDFNAPSKTPEITKMAGEGGFRDSFGTLYPETPGLTWDNANPYAGGSNHPLPDRRIDYIFIRNASVLLSGLSSSQVVYEMPGPEGIYASDHYGLLDTFLTKGSLA